MNSILWAHVKKAIFWVGKKNFQPKLEVSLDFRVKVLHHNFVKMSLLRPGANLRFLQQLSGTV